jgi:large subunit ribosomal protein L35
MPKMKSHSGAKKRIRMTGSGKLAMKRHSKNHLLQQKSKRQKRLNSTIMVDATNIAHIRQLVPNI